MHETPITVVGRVCSEITPRVTATGEKMASFRITCVERRYDKAQSTWVDGDRMYLGVLCFRKLADGVLTSISKGDHVVVAGRFRVGEYTTDDGHRRSSPEILARVVGPDLGWHTVMVNHSSWPERERPPELTEAAAPLVAAVLDEEVRQPTAA